jgi:hypothetical protein
MTPEELANISPYLELNISKKAKRIALRLDTTRRVMKLVVPERFNMKKARAFALEHQGWIKAKVEELPAPVRFTSGSIIPVLGQDRVLNIEYDKTVKITTIELTAHAINVCTNQSDPTNRIIRFLKREARLTLGNLAREKAMMIDKQIRSIQIRDTKTRWGSCGPDGTISFSWRLIFAPWLAMDYVVAHEIAHLVHMNHGKSFWTLCEKLSDGYHEGKAWMKHNGNELMRYG